MALKNVYRSLMISGISVSVLLNAACSDTQKKHQTIKAEQYERWNMAKLSVQVQLAQQQYIVGDYDKCRQTIDGALAAGQPYAPLQILAGKLDIEKGSMESAAAHLKEAVRINPKDPEAYYLLGVVYQRWQKMEVACDYYQQAWDRKAAEARYMLAVVEMKITMGEMDQARQILEDKMVYFEQSAAVRVALGRIASLRGDYLGASRHYRDAYMLAPEDMSVKRQYAEALYFAGKYAEVAPMLEDLRTHVKEGDGESPESANANRMSLTLMLAQAYLNLHRPLNARTCYQEVLRQQPDHPQAVLGLGRVCVETNELSAAMAAGRKVLKSEPRNVQALVLVAMVQQKQKKWEDALATLQTATSIAPKDSTVLCMAGVSVLRLGKQDEAAGYFIKAVAANPKDTWATELLGSVKPVVMEEKGSAQIPQVQVPVLGEVTNAVTPAETLDGR